ncbi:hypothetical protein BFN03_09020 [Rhodococcus sp. WMMA185]|nr:hypothetical protein BFN03_09020 [Rhodococcus sp. WMMA185]
MTTAPPQSTATRPTPNPASGTRGKDPVPAADRKEWAGPKSTPRAGHHVVNLTIRPTREHNEVPATQQAPATRLRGRDRARRYELCGRGTDRWPHAVGQLVTSSCGQFGLA